MISSEACSCDVNTKNLLAEIFQTIDRSCFDILAQIVFTTNVAQSKGKFFSKTQHEAKRLMKKVKEKQSLSEIHQCLPSQADRSQTLKRVEIITAEAGAKAQGITLRRWGYISSARLEFCGSFEEFR
jgi:di/tripeptidase